MGVKLDKFVDENPEYDYQGTVVKAGVNFARFEKGGEVVYARLSRREVEEPFFSRVGRDGNYTYGIVVGESEKRMVDDAGVHEPLRTDK